MTLPTNTLMIDGNVDDLTVELAKYIDSLQKSDAIQPEVTRLIKEQRLEDALKVLVLHADTLNSAPEKCECGGISSTGTILMNLEQSLPHTTSSYTS
jgi:hypothetical protein